MMMPPKTRRAALLGVLLVLPLVSASGRSAEPDTAAAVSAYLNGRYYEIEFFIFERTDVLDFRDGETLALERPRALPHLIRTQRLAPEALWTDPIDAHTRLCLTFPTITYEWAPDIEAQDGTLGLVSEDEPAIAVPAINPRLEPNPQLDFLAQVAAFERSLREGSERWQPAERFTLAPEAGRVTRSGIGRVLFHGRWLQNVPDRESPDPILILAGQTLTAPRPVRELVGSVGVTLGRYLHFQAELFLHGPGFGLAPTGAVLNADGSATLQARPLPGPAYMMLSESRRMRSGELHYLDHPKLGLVARIDTIALPAELLQAYEAFQESLD